MGKLALDGERKGYLVSPILYHVCGYTQQDYEMKEGSIFSFLSECMRRCGDEMGLVVEALFVQVMAAFPLFARGKSS